MQNSRVALISILFFSFTCTPPHEDNSILVSASAPSPAPYFPREFGSPAPAPEPVGGDSWPRVGLSPPAPPLSEPPATSPTGLDKSVAGALSPKTEEQSSGGSGDGDSGNVGSPARTPEPETVTWCTVGEEVVDCRYVSGVLSQASNYTWKCVRKETTKECLEAIKQGEADLINLEAGLAFTAFLNFSLKAIASEVYCNHAGSYESVAVVPRSSCKSRKTSLMDFKGVRSCHGTRSSASGWNYPMDHLRKRMARDRSSTTEEIATGFFSEVCAPSASGFEQEKAAWTCGGCGLGESGSCDMLYSGDRGAFRCLMEGLGDIAFVRGDTPLFYSMEGPYNRSWSTKSIHDFLYLCPEGGCQEINGYPGACSFGRVPGNVIIASNSLPNSKRLIILNGLENVSWVQSSYSAKVDSNHLLSPSTQELRRIETLTRAYLGQSASISQSMLRQNTAEHDSAASTEDSFPGASSSSQQVLNFWTLLSVLIVSFHYC